MKNKKGIGLLISWVLLIGLGVTLAVFATTWARQYAEESTSRIAKMVISDMRCDDVSIGAKYDSCTLTIKNTGYFTIEYVVLRSNGDPENIDQEIKPTESTEYTKCVNPGNKIDLIPVIKSGKELIGCTDKKITINN